MGLQIDTELGWNPTLLSRRKRQWCLLKWVLCPLAWAKHGWGAGGGIESGASQRGPVQQSLGCEGHLILHDELRGSREGWLINIMQVAVGLMPTRKPKGVLKQQGHLFCGGCAQFTGVHDFLHGITSST